MNVDPGTARHINAFSGQKDKLVDDIKSVLTDAEEMLRKARTSSAEGYSAIRAELEDRLGSSIVRLQEVQAQMKSRARQAVRVTDEYVHDNPWKSMSYVAIAGLVLGLILTRRH